MFPATRPLAAAGPAALLVLAAACSDDERIITSGGPRGAPPADVEVAVRDNFFDPSGAQIEVGETVQWAWEGLEQHSVTFVDPALSSSAVQGEGTFTRSFDRAGTFAYYCSIHGSPSAGMRGGVTVGEGTVDTTVTGY